MGSKQHLQTASGVLIELLLACYVTAMLSQLTATQPVSGSGLQVSGIKASTLHNKDTRLVHCPMDAWHDYDFQCSSALMCHCKCSVWEDQDCAQLCKQRWGRVTGKEEGQRVWSYCPHACWYPAIYDIIANVSLTLSAES